MIYKDAGFRPFYHSFVLVPLKDNLKGIADGYPGPDSFTHLLTYCYYDVEAGITLAILAKATKESGNTVYEDSCDEIHSMIRIGAVEEDELLIVPDDNGDLAKKYSKKLDMLKGYNASKDVENTREKEFLDGCRHPQYIDDFQVYFIKDGCQAELCWVRMAGTMENIYVGTLLNEPNQDLGCHMNEKIKFFAYKTAEGEIICVSDCNGN